jgi:hypothetical protein
MHTRCVQEWRNVEASLRLRAMGRKIGELRASAESLLQEAEWVDAPKGDLARIGTMEKAPLASLVAAGQLALQRARERAQELKWARVPSHAHAEGCTCPR